MTPTFVPSETQVEFPEPCADATGDASVEAGGAPGARMGLRAAVDTDGAVGNGRPPSPRMPTSIDATTDDAPSPANSAAALSADQFTRVAKALADPRRFTILEIIAAHGEIACQSLCAELPVKQATVSHHVKELAAAGLVETRRDGQFVYYRYVPTVMRQYRETLAHRVAA